MRVLIPAHVWESMLDEFARHAPGVERVAYLDGYVLDESGYPGVDPTARTGIVTTVVYPDATLAPGRYRVDADAMQDAGRHLPALRMRRLAQVHTHGNNWVGHSSIDDKLAFSQRPGAISIVLPFHGVNRPGPHDAGVMVSAGQGTWHRVVEEDLAEHIQFIPSHIDHREPSCLTSPRAATTQGGRTTGISSRFVNHVRRMLDQLNVRQPRSRL